VALSLAVQATHLRWRYPDGRIVLTPTRLTFVAAIRPTELSPDYEVVFVLESFQDPIVYVVDPPLQRLPGRDLPHVFDADTLCLFVDAEWHPVRLLGDTIVPWASDWLFHYEAWLATGRWEGGGVHPDATPTNRALRRWDTRRPSTRRRVRSHRVDDALAQAYGSATDRSAWTLRAAA
jgi:hypothetical protein